MAYDTIISRLGTRWTNGIDSRSHPDLFTRDIGGQHRNNQPYISGYFLAMFGLPEKLFGSNAGGIVEIASKYLHSTCEGFTPHTQTITMVDVQGIGQTGSSFPVNVTTSREFTTTHREMQNMPILNIIRKWAGLFDPFTGVSVLKGVDFIPSSYKGWFAIAQIKPVRSEGNQIEEGDIEEGYIYNGVFPTNIPVDTASATDITGNDTVQLSVTWKFDGAPMTTSEPGITAKLVSLFNGLNVLDGQAGTFEKHHRMAMSVTPFGSSSGNIKDTQVVVDG